MSVVNSVTRGLKQEARILASFVTSPKGPFETVDQIIKTGRSTVRQAARSMTGGRKPFNALRLGGASMKPLARIKRSGLSPQKLRAQAKRRIPRGMKVARRVIR